jgi:stearoyl-CoA desaturase (delta-9 desaturase)
MKIRHEKNRTLSRHMYLILANTTVLLPFLAFLLFLFLWFTAKIQLHKIDWVLFIVMFIATGLGITIGYHRFFTHRSFKTSKAVQGILIALGSMTAEGPLIFWVGIHRKHHQFADALGDPHSPNLEKKGMLNKIKGFFHAHVGWMLSGKPANYLQYVPDLLHDEFIFKVSGWYFYWLGLGLLFPAVIEGLWEWSWLGFAQGFLISGLVRIFFTQNMSWSVNSVCHTIGNQGFSVPNWSRNNMVIGILALGEGWHNNHHAFPTSARHGLTWWQLDFSYYIIKLLNFLGLAQNIILPNPMQVEKKIK